MATTTVFGTLSVLKGHLKLKRKDDFVAIDNIIFRLHYRATLVALLMGCLLVSSQQFFGAHIKCSVDKKDLPRTKVIETFCFFTSTYTVTKLMNQSLVDKGIASHPGVGPYTEKDDIVWHTYYQWVPFALFFQALLFSVPRYLWKNAEGGRLKALVSDLKMTSLSIRGEQIKVGKRTIPSLKDRDEKIQILRQAFLNRIHINRPWAYYLALCEVLNLINVIAQIYITNKFLNGQFIGIGDRALEHTKTGDMTPLDMIFPKVTKCTFYKYGPSGTIENHDSLCILALNIINEKIYTFLWFWFYGLSIITFLGLLWRIAAIILHSRSEKFNRLVFTLACPGKNNPWESLHVTHKAHFSDWLFLYYIAKNVDNDVFREVILQLGHDLDNRIKLGFEEIDPVGEKNSTRNNSSLHKLL